MPDTTGLSQVEVDARLQIWSDDWVASIEADPASNTSSVASRRPRRGPRGARLRADRPLRALLRATLPQYYIRQHPDRVRVAIMDGEHRLMCRRSSGWPPTARPRWSCCSTAAPTTRPATPPCRICPPSGRSWRRRWPRESTPVWRIRIPARRWWRRSTKSPGPPPGAAGPSDRRPAAARDPPRLRGTVGTGQRALPGVDGGRRRLAGDERDHHVLGGVGGSTRPRSKTSARAAICCRRSSLTTRRGNYAARRFRRASYRPTMRRRSPPSRRSCGSPATATPRTRQPT